jgi:hypothetical protein
MIPRLRAENEAALKKILEPRQRTRLDQIVLQIKGPLAVAEPEIAARLNIGPDQAAQIQAILDEYQQAQAQAWTVRRERIDAASLPPANRSGVSPKGKTPAGADGRAADGDAQEKRVQAEIKAMEDESQQLYREALRQVARVLTRRQKTIFDKMLGPPFDVARLSLRGVKADPNATPAPADSPTILEPLSPSEPPATAPAATRGGTTSTPSASLRAKGN